MFPLIESKVYPSRNNAKTPDELLHELMWRFVNVLQHSSGEESEPTDVKQLHKVTHLQYKEREHSPRV